MKQRQQIGTGAESMRATFNNVFVILEMQEQCL